MPVHRMYGEGAGTTITTDRLRTYLSESTVDLIDEKLHSLHEIRLRTGKPVQLIGDSFDMFSGEPISSAVMKRILSALMDFSVYSREEDIKNGFFSMEDGCRIGVCGKMIMENGQISGMSHIGSICIRISREIKGCAEEVIDIVCDGSRIFSTLIVSPPGMGKTTCLRDLARLLSHRGYCIGICDERHELAACVHGIPALDTGLRTDIMDGCPKWMAVERMVRSMAPDIIITDEIGSEQDAWALEDAMRCGVSIMASAHGSNYEMLKKRKHIGRMLDEGVFEKMILLGEEPGRIVEVRDL